MTQKRCKGGDTLGRIGHLEQQSTRGQFEMCAGLVFPGLVS
jgi:hypothetical protein